MTSTATDDARKIAIDNFVAKYNELAQQASRAERENNTVAVNLHIQISGMITHFVKIYENVLIRADVEFLRSECVARCMQALLLRSMELSGFGDLALSLSSTRKLNEDITNARRRIEENRGGNDEGNDRYDTSDPRIVTNGLYEYISFESLHSNLADLPGYEKQHRALMHAYYILEPATTAAASSITSDDSKIAATTRSGANAILYGPPGTGKTAAAKAVAASLRLDFVFVNTENILSSYRSETEKNLRTLYHKMRLLVRTTKRNVVLLLDEVDGLVKNRRGVAGISSGDYSLLTKFLTILEPNDDTDNYGIFSIFTTNDLGSLDDAFRRRCVAIFFGSVTERRDRVRLFRKFFSDVVRYDSYRDDAIADTTVHWVPGDYVRFKRDVIQPMQLTVYLKEKNISMDEFYERTGGAGGASSRSIPLDLPFLTYSDIEEAMFEYQPVTSDFSKYEENTNGGALTHHG